jgi:GNAT superfamily N-acetyltransferase
VSELEIRYAGPGDEDVIADLISRAFGQFKDVYTPDAFEYTVTTADRIRERFEEGPILLAYDGDAPVGTVSGMPDLDRFYIRSMAVSPDVQGRGIGQALLDTVTTRARELGFGKLYLYTTFVLPGARPLYEKNGFCIVRETSPEEWFGMGGLEMEKTI